MSKLRIVSLVFASAVSGAACGGATQPPAAAGVSEERPRDASVPDALSPSLDAGAPIEVGDGGVLPDAAPPLPAPLATVKLLDPGAAPRRSLRYAFRQGEEESAWVTLSMTMGVGADNPNPPEVVLPRVRSTFDLTRKRVTPAGDLTYDFKLVTSEVTSKPGMRPEIAEAMREEMNKLAGLSGSAVVDAKGRTKEAHFDVPAGASRQTEQLLEHMRETVEQMSAPFPDEAVGRGARWVRIVPVKTRALTVNSEVTYTLTEWTRNRGTLGLTIRQTAEPQAIVVPNAPNANLKLESFNSVGKGTIKFDLTQIVPKSEAQTATLMTMRAEDRGRTHDLTMSMKIGIAMQHKPKEH